MTPNQAHATDPIALYRPDTPEFRAALAGIIGGETADWLEPALPYSAVARNDSGEAIALLAIRFDFTGKSGKKMSVIQISDTLRNPEKSEFGPRMSRFFCAEPEYASAVMRGESNISARAVLNLKNLRTTISMRASIDCFAFADGRFYGPDTGGAFERFRLQSESEQGLISGVLSARVREEHLLTELNSDNAARRALAAKLLDELTQGGAPAMLDCARRHRCRIELIRVPEPRQ